ncbi:MAG: glycosyltransferase [Candidatus Eisenbacteria bacterium]|nr:glycosyltransferase [Candidatus Eisenbacteria bacterium]
MHVLQITLRDLEGRRFNGYDLHRALIERGHGSEMLVVRKGSRDPLVHAHTAAGEVFERALYGAERVTSLQGMLSPFGWTMPMRRCFRGADVVHWHLVYPHFIGIFSAPVLARRRPTIWTLHDPWAMTGHCVHPLDCERWKTGCGRCPDLSRNFAVWFDTTAMVWRAKRAAYTRAPITLVVASAWMARRVAASPLLRDHACRVIPFGLDLERWRPLDRAACRARLGIPADAHVLAFRVPHGARQLRTKGIATLLDALRRLELTRPTHLIVLEAKGALEDLRGRYTLHESGWIDDEARLAESLAAADLFIMPSIAESFGLMALEAMACGTPAVVSAGTVLEETTRAPEAGTAVPVGDAAALAAAVRALLGDDARRAALARRGREIVERDHGHERYIARHVELYRELAERGAGA